jgi:hypothetical protein
MNIPLKKIESLESGLSNIEIDNNGSLSILSNCANKCKQILMYREKYD